MIFAAGMGTRLKPLTDVIPKALVPVGDKPLLQIVLERLLDADIRNVVVNVHHKSAQICNYLKLLQSYYDVQISVSDESEQLLETGGGIRKAQGLFDADAPILIHNVDILSNVDLGAFYDNIGDADALLLVSEILHSSLFTLHLSCSPSPASMHSHHVSLPTWSNGQRNSRSLISTSTVVQSAR